MAQSFTCICKGFLALDRDEEIKRAIRSKMMAGMRSAGQGWIGGEKAVYEGNGMLGARANFRSKVFWDVLFEEDQHVVVMGWIFIGVWKEMVSAGTCDCGH